MPTECNLVLGMFLFCLEHAVFQFHLWVTSHGSYMIILFYNLYPYACIPPTTVFGIWRICCFASRLTPKVIFVSKQLLGMHIVIDIRVHSVYLISQICGAPCMSCLSNLCSWMYAFHHPHVNLVIWVWNAPSSESKCTLQITFTYHYFWRFFPLYPSKQLPILYKSIFYCIQLQLPIYIYFWTIFL